MSFKGRVQNGVVVLPPDVNLPEGTEVEILPSENATDRDPLLQAVRNAAKPRPHWPKDYVLNHGHYVNGEPKKP